MWTDERVEQLRKLHAEGLSFSQIASEIGGISRNGCIGKAGRIGLAKRGMSPPRAPRQPRPVGVPVKRMRIDHHDGGRPKIVEETYTERPVLFEPPIEQRKSLMQLTNKTCRFPFGDPTEPDFYFCGGHTEELPYCAAHARIAYKPLQERRVHRPFRA
jgi:GcrA cell cycle regulator